MSLLTTLALVAAPLARPRDREAELRKRLAAVEAERDLWRAECLTVRQRLTEAVVDNVVLMKQIAALGPVEWTECTCVPGRAAALK